MKKFVLKLTSSSWILDIEKILNLQRQFYSIAIEQHELSFTYATRKVLSEHGGKLRHLKLTKVAVQSLEDLLQFAQLLESLELENVKVNDQRKTVSLPSLKHLKIEACSDEVLDLINDAKHLSSLEIVSYENREIVMRFLMQHPTLDSLTIGYKVLENFFQADDITTVPFRLQKLDFSGYPMAIVAHEERLKNFLKLHAPTLHHLRMPHIITAEISQIVFTQLRNLTTLSINVDSLPTEKSFYCCMSPLEKVTTLRLIGKFPKHEVAKLFIANFPNVTSLNMKHLTCSIWFMKFLHKISQHQKKIEHLKIANFFKGASPYLQFQNLKTLFVMNSSNIALWKNFVLTHSSSLEEITVKNLLEEGKLKSKDVEDLLELPKLRKVSIGGDSKCIEEIWQFFRKDFKNLKELNFRIKTSKGHHVNKKIIFPNDKQFWSAEKCDKYLKSE